MIEAEEVAGGIAERSDPWGLAGGIAPGRHDDLAAMGCDLGKSGVNIVDPNVGQERRLTSGLAAGNPSAANVAGGVIETGARSVTVADAPAEYLLIKCGGLEWVNSGNFEITDSRAAQQLKTERRLHDCGAPLVGADIARVS